MFLFIHIRAIQMALARTMYTIYRISSIISRLRLEVAVFIYVGEIQAALYY